MLALILIAWVCFCVGFLIGTGWRAGNPHRNTSPLERRDVW